MTRTNLFSSPSAERNFSPRDFLIAGRAGELVLPGTVKIGLGLLWLSAILTLYTGWDYMKAGVKHVVEE